MDQIFLEIGVVIIVATFFAYLLKLLRQPMIPAYIITGLLIGPFGLKIVSNQSVISNFAEIGVAFLLFVVGLELDLKRLKDIGLVATVGGAIQIVVLFGFGYLIGAISGVFTKTELLYIGLFVAFSSTMVVVKLLGDKKVLDTLHGRIVLGILLMEDLVAIVALSIINAFGAQSLLLMFASICYTIGIFAGLFLVTAFIFPPIFRFAARSQELLFLVALATCFLFSIIAGVIGFSIAIGGFIAGVTIANLPYNLEIIGRVKPLRDFFSTLFFVSLGMGLSLSGMGNIILPLIVLIIFIILLKPLVTMAICSVFGYTKRTCFLTAISLPQISEFGLILVSQGALAGQISHNLATMAVLLAIVTMTITSYFSKFENQIYGLLSKPLSIFDKPHGKEFEYTSDNRKYDVILIGYDRIGFSIAKTMKKLRKRWIVVDFNPDIIKRLIREKVNCIYGDISDIEVFERLNFGNARIVISTMPDLRDNLLLLQRCRHANPKITVFVTSNNLEDALKLYEQGADYVIMPHFLGGDHASLILEEISKNRKQVVARKLAHIEELKARQSLGHSHPLGNNKNEH